MRATPRRDTATRAVIWPSLGLIVWAAHFGAIYALHAHACERGLEEARLLGLPHVPAAVGLATLLALAPLGLIGWLAAPRLREVAGTDGREPRFTDWFGAGAVALGAFAVLFQAAPAFVLPVCWGY